MVKGRCLLFHADHPVFSSCWSLRFTFNRCIKQARKALGNSIGIDSVARALLWMFSACTL